jgi:hypothetical protein
MTHRRSRAGAFAAAAVVLGACSGDARGHDPAGAAHARQLIVAIDLSGSQSADRRTQARHALELAIEELGPGDRIVLLQVHQRSAAEDGAVRWAETVPAAVGNPPTSVDRERVAAVKQAARSVARTIFDAEGAGSLPTTDLFATLHVAGEYVLDAGSRRTVLLLLSDMLQSAHGIEMSRPGGVPGGDWIERQARAGVLPRLDGACVAVVGADATTANGVAVREFWKRYFEAAGAELQEIRYRLIATGGGPLLCR